MSSHSRFLSVGGVFALLLSFGGCFDEEITFKMNPDGSGVIQVNRTIDDRVTVMFEEMDALAQIPFFNFAGLAGSIGSDEWKQLEKMGFTITDEKLETLPTGEMKVSYVAAFSNVEQLSNPEATDLLPFHLSRNEAGELVLRAELFDMEGAEDESTGTTMMNEQVPLGILYGLLKGYHRKISATLPQAVTTQSGKLSEDKLTVSWEFDLRNRQGLEATREVYAKSVLGYVEATAKLGALAEGLPAYEAVPTAGRPASEKPTSAKPEARPASGKYALNVARIEVVRSRTLEPIGQPEVASATVFLNLSWSEDTPFLRYEEPVLKAARDDQGNDLVESLNYFTMGGTQDEPGVATIQVPVGSPSASAAKILGFSGSLKVISAKEIKKAVLDPAKLESLVGAEKTGVAALDAEGGRITELSDSSFTLQLGPADSDNKRSIKKATMTLKSGGTEEAWSTNCMWGECSVMFMTELSEAKSIELAIPAGEIVEEIVFGMDEIPLP